MASRQILYDWMHLRLGPIALPRGVLAVLVFISLLRPTFWIGVSLPALSRAVTEAISSAARRVGLLYGLNTVGAAVGAFVTTWVLFPRVGLERCVQIAALLNIVAAVAVLPAVLRVRRALRESHQGQSDDWDAAE